jgi:hypothetical protein
MPHVSVVQLDIQLPADAAIDLFLLQLHSPPPVEAGAPIKLPATVATRRGQFLTALAAWVTASYCAQTPQRPVFVVAPELSIPLEHTGVLEMMVRNLDRPAIIIAGLEFLRWQEYRRLVEGMASMPSPASWLEGGRDGHWVNAALILVRDAAGAVQKFIQPKRNPSDGEAATHFPGRNVLVFQSRNQIQGVHLNFCVQICADFTNHRIVADLRRACEEISPGRPLDFTFVLQRNENQDAPQFKQSIKAYFDPPVGMVETARGSLVFVNNARAATGGTDWGDSMMLFPFEKWRMSGAPTFWIRDDGANNHQGVLMREAGPAAFWLRYKPQYLVSSVAGAGQPGPFVDNHALALTIVDDFFPEDPEFRPIPAVAHWLRQRWVDGRGTVAAALRSGGCPEAVQAGGEAAYDEVLARWHAIVSGDDLAARLLVGLYFCCFTQRGYPAGTTEPRKWVAAAEHGAREFLATCALLQLGAGAAGALTPHSLPETHARVGGLLITLVWGGGTHTAGAMITSVLNRLAIPAAVVGDGRLVVLIESRDTPERDKLAELVESHSVEITRAEQPRVELITDAAAFARPVVVCSQAVWAEVCYTQSLDEARRRVSTLLTTAGR